MKELILIKNGEIALKGLNRFTFEDRLIKNIKNRIKSTGKYRFYKAQSIIYVEPLDENCDIDGALEKILKTFGISAAARACIIEKDFEKILQAVDYIEDRLLAVSSFKVISKRADKTFPMKSPEICAKMGEYILEKFPNLHVDVHNPELTVYVEIRDYDAFIHSDNMQGAGGMPIGTSGRCTLLLSGGIDSPVAGYMMAKRGLELSAVHFVSPPYTSERAKMKVVSLAEKMCDYCDRINLNIVNFTKIQEAIRDNCPEELFTIIMRRFMMRIAEKIAIADKSDGLITGESLAQVASQTLLAIACTNAVCTIPVFRPVIGMDKEEIITVARKIDTFDISIEPYEDCCTVFTPRRPKTKPKLQEVEQAEALINDSEQLINEAVESCEAKAYFN